MRPIGLRAFARERLTVGATVKTLTQSVFEDDGNVGNVNRKRASYARVQVQAAGGDIIATIEGTTPDATHGETWKPVAAGFDGVYELMSWTEIKNFKAVRATVDTGIEVTYFG